MAALVGAVPVFAPLLGGTGAAAAANPPHVMVIVEENQGYSNIIGNSKAPYINSLASGYASATKWYGLTDNSLADYVALISGYTGSYSKPTLVGELSSADISWKAYMEDMPSVCYTGPGVGNYEKVHNPFVYFKSITGDPAQCDRIVPFAGSGGFASDLNGNKAPDFMYVVPNICDDMHTACPKGSNKITQGDQWLHANLPTVFNSQWYAEGGIVIITWDSALPSDNERLEHRRRRSHPHHRDFVDVLRYPRQRGKPLWNAAGDRGSVRSGTVGEFVECRQWRSDPCFLDRDTEDPLRTTTAHLGKPGRCAEIAEAAGHTLRAGPSRVGRLHRSGWRKCQRYESRAFAPDAAQGRYTG